LKAHKPALVARLASADVRDDPRPIAPPRANGAIPWDELALWRWGPESEPAGIIIDRPDPARRRLALESLRVAIQAEAAGKR
jgi:hypothetical protein